MKIRTIVVLSIAMSAVSLATATKLHGMPTTDQAIALCGIVFAGTFVGLHSFYRAARH